MNKAECVDILIKNLSFAPSGIKKIELYVDLILKFNKKYNIISKNTEKDVWNRHILDSAQIVRFIDFSIDGSLSDLGSGAGFPGIILSIFNTNKNFHVKLYEKSKIKCNFLKALLTMYSESIFPSKTLGYDAAFIFNLLIISSKKSLLTFDFSYNFT